MCVLVFVCVCVIMCAWMRRRVGCMRLTTAAPSQFAPEGHMFAVRESGAFPKPVPSRIRAPLSSSLDADWNGQLLHPRVSTLPILHLFAPSQRLANVHTSKSTKRPSSGGIALTPHARWDSTITRCRFPHAKELAYFENRLGLF